VIPAGKLNCLWKTLWLNVLTLEDHFNKKPKIATAEVFPWMGKTYESKNDVQVSPEMVDELQLYWGTPRRIRLFEYSENGVCDVCGCTARIWKSYKTINYGVKYSSKWLHTLSPYRRQQEKDESISLIATKGKQGGFSYHDWLSLTLVNDPKKKQTAQVIRNFIEKKRWCISDSNFRIWCYGFDMDNMKARCWYDQTMPILVLPADKCPVFIENIQKVISAALDSARLLRDQVKAAWFKRPKEAKGDTYFILSSFWEETESSFFVLASKIREAIVSDVSAGSILVQWHAIIIKTAERLFDHFALQDTDEIKNMKRIAEAAKALSNILHSPKTKSIQALKEAV
jgi:CRISPR system Cascade subunit CasA